MTDSPTARFDTNQYYLWKDGAMHNGLVVVTWQLVDHNESDGGLVRSPSYASAHHTTTSLKQQLLCGCGDSGGGAGDAQSEYFSAAVHACTRDAHGIR